MALVLLKEAKPTRCAGALALEGLARHPGCHVGLSSGRRKAGALADLGDGTPACPCLWGRARRFCGWFIAFLLSVVARVFVDHDAREGLCLPEPSAPLRGPVLARCGDEP